MAQPVAPNVSDVWLVMDSVACVSFVPGKGEATISHCRAGVAPSPPVLCVEHAADTVRTSEAKKRFRYIIFTVCHYQLDQSPVSHNCVDGGTIKRKNGTQTG